MKKTLAVLLAAFTMLLCAGCVNRNTDDPGYWENANPVPGTVSDLDYLQ